TSTSGCAYPRSAISATGATDAAMVPPLPRLSFSPKRNATGHSPSFPRGPQPVAPFEHLFTLCRSDASAGPEERGRHATEAGLRAIQHYLRNNPEIGADVKAGGETGIPPSGHNCTAKVADTCAVSAVTVESLTQRAKRPLSVPWISP